jgi:RNA polymerase sigma factor for flagellar operon FliA
MDSRQQDAELIARYVASNDPVLRAQLREEIVLRYVPLVHFALGRLGLSQGQPDYEDAASQGLLGLIESVERYNPAFGTMFSTYATLRIRGKVIDYLRSQDWLSRGARRRARQVQAAVAALWEQHGRAPSDDELAAYLNVDAAHLQQALVDSSRSIVSLDALAGADAGGGGDEASLHEILPDANQEEPLVSIEEEELRLRLVECLKKLPRREQIVLSLYYHDELTFKEIGAVLEVSESRVCQLHGRAILSLRASLAGNPPAEPAPAAARPKLRAAALQPGPA